MPSPGRGTALRQMRSLFNVGTMAGLTDSQLLDRFLSPNDEAAELAFSALVERYGAMVLRICRGVLSDPDDAHDAFQAVFLVLVRRASAIRRRDSLASWIHGVSLRVASSSRSASIRRGIRERRFASTERVEAYRDDQELRDLQLAVHEEVDRLPETFRGPITLCDLQEKTQEEAAEQLGVPIGTVKSRLVRGRDRLRSRLVRRGLAPATALGITLGNEAHAFSAWSSVSRSLVKDTATAAMEFAAGRAGLGLFRASSAYLAQGVLRMIRFQTWMRRALLFVPAALGLGLFAPTPSQALDEKPAGSKQSVGEPQICFRMSFLEMDGVGWREKLGEKLELKEQMESQTIWTMTSTKDAQEIRILAATEKQGPNVTAFQGSKASLTIETPLNYVAGLKSIYDGDGGVAFQPKVQTLKHGSRLEVTGKTAPDGIFINASVKETHLVSMTQASLFAQSKNHSQTIRGAYQVPELAKSELSGEWIVPRDGALIMSLGVHRIAGRFRFGNLSERMIESSSLRERLVLIEPLVIVDVDGELKVQGATLDDVVKKASILPSPTR